MSLWNVYSIYLSPDKLNFLLFSFPFDVFYSGTVRQFLEKQKNNVTAVVFCTTSTTDTEIYKRYFQPYFPFFDICNFLIDTNFLMVMEVWLIFFSTWPLDWLFIFTMHVVSCRLLPLYFPRDKHEEQVSLSKLPADVGDENGETIIDERKTRIKPLPKKVFQDHLMLQLIFLSAILAWFESQ